MTQWPTYLSVIINLLNAFAAVVITFTLMGEIKLNAKQTGANEKYANRTVSF